MTEREFGTWVREQREARGWTLVELAGRLGVGRDVIWRLEQGKRQVVGLDEINELARIFGVAPGPLLYPEESTSESLEAAGEVRELMAMWPRLPKRIRELHLEEFRVLVEGSPPEAKREEGRRGQGLAKTEGTGGR